MQFQVPQFIETEDKVVGPFSIRQFIYVGAAALVSAILYFLLATWLFAIAAFILMGGALAISFVKIEGRPLIAVIRSAANFYWKPQTYVWQPEHAMIAQHRPVAEKKAAALPVKDVSSAVAARKKWEDENAKKDEPSTLEKVLSGGALHAAWENIQNGSPLAAKKSDKQFLEGKMAERYQIFQKLGGDREAARRVDYR